MSTPRNNLEDVLKRYTPSAVADKPQAAPTKISKFKPAGSKLGSFSTPGFGKARPAPVQIVESVARVPLSSNADYIDLSSGSSTPSDHPSSSVPLKRSSSDATPLSSKRLKVDVLSDKGNCLEPSGTTVERLRDGGLSDKKGKGRAYNMTQQDTCDNLSWEAETGDKAWQQMGTLKDAKEWEKTDSQLDLGPLRAELRTKTVEEIKKHRALTCSTQLANFIQIDEWREQEEKESCIHLLMNIKKLVARHLKAIDEELTARKREDDQLFPTPVSVPRTRSFSPPHSATLVSLGSELAPVPVRQASGIAGTSAYSTLQRLETARTFNADRKVNISTIRDVLPGSDDDYWATQEDIFEGIIEQTDTANGQNGVDAIGVDLSFETAASISMSVNRPDLTSTPYYGEIMRVLKNVFSLHSFRPHQLEAIHATLDGQDVFVLMPTGGGKSLCYQLPAVCQGGKTKGVSIVVSPLIALMHDQVNSLKEKGVDVMLFTGDQDAESRQENRSRLVGNGRKPSLLYVTPEKLHHSNDMRNILHGLYNSGQLARFVVDEAHCLSTWGQDFRHSYQDLNRLRREFPKVPIMALTATAAPPVRKDVIDRLGIQNCKLLMQSFNRPNLHYDVRPKKQGQNLLGDINEFIRAYHSEQTGIIYCLSRINCEEVAKTLRDMHGLSARHFHAGMTQKDKTRVQEEWQTGKCKIIVATIAFGMGIDKADVRFVIHHTLPKSLDGYYQETGRAGRDGKPANCVLYFGYRDAISIRHQIHFDEQSTPDVKERQEEALEAVIQYCQNDIDCRRVQVLGHFGQSFDPKDCIQSCNNCAEGVGTVVVVEDVTKPAVELIKLSESLVATSTTKVTATYCITVFKGSKLKAVMERRHDRHPLFGAGKGLSRDHIQRIYDNLRKEGAFGTELVTNARGFHNEYLKIGPKAADFLNGTMNLTMKVKHVSTHASGSRLPKTKKIRQTVQRSRTKNVTALESDEDKIELYQDDEGDEIQKDKEEEEEEEGEEEEDDIFESSRESETTWPPVRSHSSRPKHPATNPDPTELLLGPENRLHEALKRQRAKIAGKHHDDPQDVLDDQTLELLALMAPTNSKDFKEQLFQSLEDGRAVKEKWDRYGQQFLTVCIGHVHALGGVQRDSTSMVGNNSFDSADMHKRFDYSKTSPELSSSSVARRTSPRKKLAAGHTEKISLSVLGKH